MGNIPETGEHPNLMTNVEKISWFKWNDVISCRLKDIANRQTLPQNIWIESNKKRATYKFYHVINHEHHGYATYYCKELDRKLYVNYR